MPDELLQINGVELSLRRPGSRASGLRGWDAADELLLEQALEGLRNWPEQRVLILDDQFGALTLGLAGFSPVTLADSAALISALRLNVTDNLPYLEPESWLKPPVVAFDLVVMRIPRQADYLAWLLRWVNQVLDPSGLILAGGMIKHLPDRSAQVFNELVQTQTVCPAQKKARVVIAKRGPQTLEDWSEQWRGYRLPDTNVQVDALPAVFSRRKLDIGTRELLPFVRQLAKALPPGSRVLDLACGNGALGLAALSQRKDLDVTFSDVSSQAVLSARHNVERAFPEARAHFIHGDGVSQMLAAGTLPSEVPGFDLILLNPPFHEGGVVGDHIALALFEQSASVLATGGRLLMVGNRHLGYHRTLKQSFSRVRQLASAPKFVVFEAGHQASGRA
jgi:16S rRNA (guanine1207-N2)-methyltransferase